MSVQLPFRESDLLLLPIDQAERRLARFEGLLRFVELYPEIATPAEVELLHRSIEILQARVCEYETV
jgi:hypothetical protein